MTLDGTPSLYQRLIDAGYPKDSIFHHGSDLYIFVTPCTEQIVVQWCKDNGYDPRWMCPQFTDNETGRLMFDCAFQYPCKEMIE